jgi:hypothetical protein
MPIPAEVKKTVVFIFVPGNDSKPIPQGTGFFVGVKIPQDPTRYFVYLVTAKHVLRTNDNKAWLPTVFVRLNRKDSGSDTLRLDLIAEGKEKNIFTHPDPSVDIAVIPVLPDETKYDFKIIQDDLLTSKEDFKKLNITEGSEVFFTGLFVQHIGEQRNYPIVRFGRVALITDEKIDLGGVRSDVYLMEANAYGGNSGSPVFFYLGIDRQPGSVILGEPVLKLAGIVSGHFNDIIPIQVAQTNTIPFVNPNLGIAVVVPAYKLQEILFGDELNKLRALTTQPPNKKP